MKIRPETARTRHDNTQSQGDHSVIWSTRLEMGMILQGLSPPGGLRLTPPYARAMRPTRGRPPGQDRSGAAAAPAPASRTASAATCGAPPACSKVKRRAALVRAGRVPSSAHCLRAWQHNSGRASLPSKARACPADRKQLKPGRRLACLAVCASLGSVRLPKAVKEPSRPTGAHACPAAGPGRHSRAPA